MAIRQPSGESSMSATLEKDRRRRAGLLAWYDRHRRTLPWRAPAGERPDPYRVLVSEFMLQQTTAATVSGRFGPFLERFPTLRHLAAAPESEVLHAWQGLGYYRRARALHACARAAVDRHGGRLPDEAEALERLPGIGPYTARAIAAIAFGRPVVPVDGNIRRVMARLEALEIADPPAVAGAAATFGHGVRAGDVAQALMDLGATVCTPRRPHCLICPLRAGCRAHALGRPESYPPPPAPRIRPRRSTLAFLAVRPDGATLFRKRPDEGLLGGLHELPSSPWSSQPLDLEAALDHAPAPADWRIHPERVRHLFSHFELEIGLAEGAPPCATAPDAAAFWCRPEEFHRLALPTVMRKVLRLAGHAAGGVARAGQQHRG